ncbi:MAG: type II toxin-antitoxin system Phd/YefM family antitoxin [Candidatus Polarisedimenticolaceae bacterium]|nr:type II toxin-antitoxin system Phd/YefM family antitoxin [Candidatus Polarisedimenticolaceae bacterium]
MTIVNIHEAKTHLSRLLNRAVSGEEIVIARAGRGIVRLVPLQGDQLPRTPGMDAGKVRISDDFDSPLPEELLREFES